MASDELKRLIFRDLMRPWTSESFRNGAVPTGAYLAWGSSGFVEDVVKSFPEFEEDASRMKWDSTSYVFAGTIFTKPAFMGSRFGAGIITARAGDGDLRQEWIFEPTVDPFGGVLLAGARFDLRPIGSSHERARGGGAEDRRVRRLLRRERATHPRALAQTRRFRGG